MDQPPNVVLCFFVRLMLMLAGRLRVHSGPAARLALVRRTAARRGSWDALLRYTGNNRSRSHRDRSCLPHKRCTAVHHLFGYDFSRSCDCELRILAAIELEHFSLNYGALGNLSARSSKTSGVDEREQAKQHFLCPRLPMQPRRCTPLELSSAKARLA